ncbi:hypothetical protein V2G26_007285 [Clonostachys chloroleuca]
MACRHVCIRIFLFLEFAFRIDGQASPKCQYQEYVCGYELVRRGYSSSNLRVAIAKLPPGIIPPTLKDVQLLRVLYHCDDIYNSISGNAYCISGCISIDGSLENDQCYMNNLPPGASRKKPSP